MPPGLRFLYEDNHVLAIDKPPGMLSQGDLSGDLDVLTLVKEIIKRRDAKPGNVFLGLVHRLDRPVGGVMLLAKTSKAASRLSREIRERNTVKIYRAVVEGIVAPKKGELVHNLEKDRVNRLTRRVEPPKRGREARLSYQVLATRADRSLIEVNLTTGYFHQIRAQLKAIGHPVVGDRKYGSKVPFVMGRIALFSKSITFRHPTKKDSVTVTAREPDVWPW